MLAQHGGCGTRSTIVELKQSSPLIRVSLRFSVAEKVATNLPARNSEFRYLFSEKSLVKPPPGQGETFQKKNIAFDVTQQPHLLP